MSFDSTDDNDGVFDDNDIGEVVQVFRPNTNNAFAGIVLSILLCCAGVLMIGVAVKGYLDAGGNLPMNARQGHSWFSVGLFSLLGGGAIAGAAALVYYALGLFSYRVEFGEEGFRIVNHGREEGCPWHKVKGVLETITHEKPPIVKGPAKMTLPTVTSKSYLVIRDNDKQYGFDRNLISDIDAFAQAIYDATEEHGIRWESQEVHPNPFR